MTHAPIIEYLDHRIEAVKTDLKRPNCSIVSQSINQAALIELEGAKRVCEILDHYADAPMGAETYQMMGAGFNETTPNTQ